MNTGIVSGQFSVIELSKKVSGWFKFTGIMARSTGPPLSIFRRASKPLEFSFPVSFPVSSPSFSRLVGTLFVCCVSYLCCWCDKAPDKRQPKEGRFYPGSQFRSTGRHGREGTCLLEHKAAGYTASAFRMQREMVAGVLFLFLSLLNLELHSWKTEVKFRIDFPISVKPV